MTRSRTFKHAGHWTFAVRLMLRDARVSAGLTQTELAAELDRPVRWCRRIESGETEPSGLVVDQWLTLCGTTAEIVAMRNAA